jgi:hypothetical protein
LVGNCQSGLEWRWDKQDGEWECGAGSEASVKVSFSRIEGLEDKTGGYPITLRIERRLIKKLQNKLDFSENDLSDYLRFEGQCWVGNKSMMPSNLENRVSFYRDIRLTQNAEDVDGFWMNVSLQEKSGPDMGTENRWCDSLGWLRRTR